MKPRAITLDWDGTLRDAFDQVHEATNATLRHFGKNEWDLETARKLIGSAPDTALFPALFGNHWLEAYAFYSAAHDAINREHAHERPATIEGAEEFVAYLRTLKPQVHISIVSGYRGEVLRNEIARLGWSDVFDSVVALDEAPKNKPEPEAMGYALAGTGIKPEQVLHIGDGSGDRDFARNCGSKLMIIGGRVKEGLEPEECLNGLAEVQQRLQSVYSRRAGGPTP